TSGSSHAIHCKSRTVSNTTKSSKLLSSPHIMQKYEARGLGRHTSLRLERQMQGLCSVLQHSRGQDRSMRGKTEHRWQTPATSLRQGHHRSHRSDRKETRYTLHACLQNILDRNDRL